MIIDCCFISANLLHRFLSSGYRLTSIGKEGLHVFLLLYRACKYLPVRYNIRPSPPKQGYCAWLVVSKITYHPSLRPPPPTPRPQFAVFNNAHLECFICRIVMLLFIATMVTKYSIWLRRRACLRCACIFCDQMLWLPCCSIYAEKNCEHTQFQEWLTGTYWESLVQFVLLNMLRMNS